MSPRRPLHRWLAPAGAGFWLYAAHLWTVFGIALSNGLVALAAIASLVGPSWRSVPWRRHSPILLPLGLYVGWSGLSIVTSLIPWSSARSLGELSSLAALLLALVLVRGERRVRQVVDGLVVVAALLSLAGLLQLLGGFGDLDHRIRGPFSHYMTFAGVLVMADLLLASEMVCGRGARSWWRWAALVAINLALATSLTRSAWVATLLAFTLLLALRAPKLLLAYLPAATLFVVLAPVPLFHRAVSVFDLRDISNYDRVCMVEAGVHMIAERPLVGLGPDLVKVLYPFYRHPTAPRANVPHLHNTFVHVAAERGLPALAAYLWLMGASIAHSARNLGGSKRREDSRGALFMGSLLGLVAFNLAGLFEYNWGDSEVQRIALFLVAIPFCLTAVGDDPAAPGEESAGKLGTAPDLAERQAPGTGRNGG